MCNLTFGNIREYYKNKKIKYKNNEYNKINIIGKNNIFDREKIIKNNIELIIHGNNNRVNLEFDKIKGFNDKILKIHISGDNNIVSIGKNLNIHDFCVVDLAYHPATKTNNSRVVIGNNFDVVSMEIMLLENNSEFTIGDYCMFSQYIIARLSDTHCVLDLDGNLLNYGGKVNIGNHVWCGREVRILKNVSIGDNSIIGASSIVSKRFEETNIAVAGNPAKIIKRDINWSGETPDAYICKNKPQTLAAVERERERERESNRINSIKLKCYSRISSKGSKSSCNNFSHVIFSFGILG
jgi:acetyltransferase-like isoleucine patch superfamily enzyme